MLNNPVIKELIEAGVEIKFQKTPVGFSNADATLEKKGVSLVGAIEGFYKSNYVWLCELDDGELHCIARYGEDEGIIKSIDDLAKINFNWWDYSRDRGWTKPTEPEEFWLPHFIRLDLVDVEDKQVITPKVKKY